jgi:ATP-dependent Zn protease
MDKLKNKTAYHEAGHAIIAFYHRLKLGSISIIEDPDKDSRGKVQFRQFGTDEFHLEALIDSILAGRAVELKLLGDKAQNGWIFSDLNKAIDAALIIHDKFYKDRSDDGFGNVEYVDHLNQIKNQILEDDNDYLWDLESNANMFYDDHGQHIEELVNREHIWNCIVHLAKILIDKKVMNQDELIEVIQSIWKDEKVEELEEELDSMRVELGLDREWGQPF